MLKSIIFIIFLTTFSFSLAGQSNSSSAIEISDLDILCDYKNFTENGANQKEKEARKDLYLKLLGALNILGEYRKQFLQNGDLINLFPTAYYHTTLSEMKNIVSDTDYLYPIEKMNQMVSFFDAYQKNRLAWESNNKSLVEPHWEKHFYNATSGSSNIINFGCSGIAGVLESGIIAHVEYDLPRALRYAFNNRFDKSRKADELIGDFNKTDKIFPTTKEKTKSDIASVRWCAEWWQNTGEFLFGNLYKTDGDVVKMRKKSWDKAHNNSPILGIDGYEMLPQPFTKHSELLSIAEKLCNPKTSSTLFLFDLSGSMNENGANANISKLQQAKNASKQTLNGLKSNNSGSTPEVAVLGFSGGCVPDPTTVISNFETDLSIVEGRIDAMGAGGGTPLAEAIAASECKLANHLAKTGQDKGKLIVLSDGQATCQQIRPPGTYNSGQLGHKVITVSANQCGSSNYKIKYYTIGFNIAAGSPAERDLQYLSQISGGKYLNVQSQTQLERAFKKFNRTYIPKSGPSLSNLPSTSVSKFDDGVNQINSESFAPGLKTFDEFAKQHPDDCNGAYNLALMQEANDFFKNAIANYQKYLTLCPNTSDKEFVEQQIGFLEDEFRQFLLFQKEVVKSDLEYLKLHFGKIQNGQSVALAEEFKGFLKEKGDYYKNLPELMGKSPDRLFKKNCQEVATGLDNCAKTINRNPNTWDRDATPSLSMTYLNLERLLESF